MPSLRDIRKRIASVRNTQKITNAMKMVSAAKLRRAEEAIVAARPYSDKMRDVMLSLAARTNPSSHPMLDTRDVKKVLLIQVTSDRGLCGGFNANLNRRAEAFVKGKKEEDVEPALLSVGRKGHDYFRRRKISIAAQFLNVMNSVSIDLARQVAQSAIDKFLADEYQEVYLLYNRFRTAASQVLTLKKLLPISPEEAGARQLEYLYEPSEEELLSKILPRYVEVQIFSGLLDSVASEHGARMTAMEAATSNADEMIYKLTLKANRMRQETITKELMEIVGGAEALKG